MISVIVPVNNEEELLPGCLESLAGAGEKPEIIVVDGASRDRTREIARLYTEKVITLNRADLPAQLNAGAAEASGDILLFLHADSRLTPGCLDLIGKIPPQVIGGAFTMQLDGNRLLYRLLSAGGNLYCRLTGTYFGDRGIFVRSAVFQQLGGYREMPIMTDVDFSRRLQDTGRCIFLKGPVISSSRKFDREGPAKCLYLIIYALIAFRLGVDPRSIRQKYYRLPPG
jgi:rSAM/selenodomain-associated transferase 2